MTNGHFHFCVPLPWGLVDSYASCPKGILTSPFIEEIIQTWGHSLITVKIGEALGHEARGCAISILVFHLRTRGSVRFGCSESLWIQWAGSWGIRYQQFLSAKYTEHQVGKGRTLDGYFTFCFWRQDLMIYTTLTSNSLSSRLNLPVAGATCIYSTKLIKYSMPAHYSNLIFSPSW